MQVVENTSKSECWPDVNMDGSKPAQRFLGGSGGRQQRLNWGVGERKMGLWSRFSVHWLPTYLNAVTQNNHTHDRLHEAGLWLTARDDRSLSLGFTESRSPGSESCPGWKESWLHVPHLHRSPQAPESSPPWVLYPREMGVTRQKHWRTSCF